MGYQISSCVKFTTQWVDLKDKKYSSILKPFGIADLTAQNCAIP